MPAFAASLRATLPSGKDSRSLDTAAKFIMTKTLGQSSLLHRVHFKLAWLRNAAAEADERRNRYRAILGYSRRLGPDTMLVADVLREQGEKKGETINMLEVGARRQLTPLTVFAFGAGAGFGADSPRARLTTAIQHSF